MEDRARTNDPSAGSLRRHLGPLLFLVLIFFLAVLAAITRPEARNLAVAFAVPLGYMIGGGAIPTFIGIMGDAGSFATGFIAVGLLIASGAALSLLLRLPDLPRRR